LRTPLIIAAKLSFISLAFYLIFSKIDGPRLLTCLVTANLPLVILAFIVQNLSMLGSSLRSRYYLQCYQVNISKSFAIAYYYIGILFNVVLPGGIGGDGYKVYLLWKYKKLAKLLGLRIMLYERVNGFYALVFFGLITALFSSFANIIDYGFALIAACLVLITPCYLWGSKYVLRDKLKAAVGASAYSFPIQALQVLSAIILVKALLPEASLQEYIDYVFLFITASIMVIIPISIGGAGLRELTFLYGLQIMPVSDPATGVAFALLNFLLNLLTALPGAPLFYQFKSIAKR
jgi:hypothetical protein